MFAFACMCALGSDYKWMKIANKFGNDKQNPDMLSDILHCPFVCWWLWSVCKLGITALYTSDLETHPHVSIYSFCLETQKEMLGRHESLVVHETKMNGDLYCQKVQISHVTPQSKKKKKDISIFCNCH